MSINELLLSLLAKMVIVSSSAAQQMINSSTSISPKTKKSTAAAAAAAAAASSSSSNKKTGKSNNSTGGKSAASGSEMEEMEEEEDHRTCLSYIFSACASNKNREVLASACADIVIGVIMAFQLSDDLYAICENICRTSVVSLPLPRRSTHKTDHSTTTTTTTTTSSLNKNTATSAAATSSSSSSHTLDWAILKILLKFLVRFQKYLEPLDEDDLRKANLPSFQKTTLVYSHKRVLCAVCLLIVNSHEVAFYVNTLVGGIIIIFTFHHIIT